MMPLSQRLGEKKRYHYSGNSRHQSYTRGGAQGHGTGLYHHGVAVTGPGAPPLPSADARSSRYEPNVPMNKNFPTRSGSRYNPEQPAAAPMPWSGVEATSRYSGASQSGHSRYNPQPGVPPQTAPSATGSSYHGVGLHGNHHGSLARHKQRTGGSDEIYDSSTVSAAYGPRVAKWRDSSSIPSSSSFSNVGSQAQLDYDGSNFAVPQSSSKPYWRSSSAGSSGTKHYRNSYYNTKYGYQVKYGSNEGIDDRYEMPMAKKNFDKQHSLGSSLINSVPMTTKKVEKRVAYDHKRIDLKFEDESILYESENESARSVEPQNPPQNDFKSSTKSSDYDAAHRMSTDMSSTDTSGLAVSPSFPYSTKDGDSDNEVDDANDMELCRQAGNGSPLSANITTDAHEGTCFDAYVDPLSQYPHIPRSLPEPTPYPEPRIPVEGCIFPMQEPNMKLWILKNLTREERIAKQKYLLQTPIRTLSEYPFMSQNILVHEQAVRPLLVSYLSTLKHNRRVKDVLLKKRFLELQRDWESKCEKMDKMSERVRNQDYLEKRRREEEARQREEEQRDQKDNHGSGLSRRRNRADFVDDAEIESVLLQIDPDYKHHQLAASIPPMILDPIGRYSLKFKDVNNLVTDKDAWASRVLTDAIDTFSPTEHDMFVDAYLSYPKRFGKICAYMGGFRSPQECVLHYYRTKKAVNYKKLIVEKNKKRKVSNVKRRKEKEKERSKQKNDTPEAEELTSLNNGIEEAYHDKGKPKVIMEQVEIKVDNNNIDNDDNNTNDTTNNDYDYDLAARSRSSVNDFGGKVETQNHDHFPNENENIITDTASTNMEPTPNDVAVNENTTEDEEDYPRNLEAAPHDVVASVQPTENKEETNKKRPLDECKSEGADTSLLERQLSFTGSDLARDHVQMVKSDSKEAVTDDSDTSSKVIKKKTKHGESNHRSSYWSVRESDLFPSLLKQYGSQWHLISEKLGTKSTTMVRNYYQRKAAAKGWQPLLEQGNAVFARMQEGQSPTGTSVNVENDSPAGDGMSLPQAPALGYFNISKAAASAGTFSNIRAASHDLSSGYEPPVPAATSNHPGISSHQNSVPERKSPSNSLSTSTPPTLKLTSAAPISSVQHSVHFNPETQKLEPHAFDVSRRSSIRSILNDNCATVSQKAASPGPRKIDTANANVIIQELRTSAFGTTAPQTNPHFPLPPHMQKQTSWGSISSILNNAQPISPAAPKLPVPHQGKPPALNLMAHKVSDRGPLAHTLPPVLPSVAHSVAHSVSLPSHTSAFNFASDPLAALAAVASAPEALGLLSTDSAPDVKNNADPRSASSHK
ncbi:AFR623Wp [Eremothecium gossypii ATCC 10895]|uniref:AFR623Wp n=1 Tax=Eremothecium gossypii (strain ATCC 10895 / CBS 109.51 / FGSC 9923 / NRRL Y-1056) TaxID=284811 RepID=Q752F3_EREGS|nr:AFR623Wp [Eremothecium gossypii ATCC 10895]AAS53994.2 AFR623Wp [Eremothecium gossypii ATCC 10895]AEY98308.1 FAFR623Wp [Eremothecium gossypii FDAG1]